MNSDRIRIAFLYKENRIVFAAKYRQKLQRTRNNFDNRVRVRLKLSNVAEIITRYSIEMLRILLRNFYDTIAGYFDAAKLLHNYYKLIKEKIIVLSRKYIAHSQFSNAIISFI